MANAEQDTDDTAFYENNETASWFGSVFERVYSKLGIFEGLSPW